jgi:hypothetical protein
MFDLKYLRYPSSRSRSSRLLFNFDFAFSVSMLQLTGCSPQAFSYLRCSSHIRIQVFSYVVDHLLYQTIYVVTDDSAFGKHLRSRSSHSSHPVSFTVYRYCPPRYLVTLSSLSLSASFNRAYTSGPSSCCPTDHVNLSLSLQFLRRHRRHLSLLSYPLALVLSLSLSLSSATSTSQITASKPRRSSAPREGVLS